tara:strand:- start:14294 stop:15208 length:915 start_codon:yes stop_codon:yes gene_type:complete
MPLEYKKNEGWEELLPVLEEHGQWFHDLIEFLFYSQEDDVVTGINKPTSFAQWVVYVNESNQTQPEIVEKLTALHADLFETSDVLLASVKKNNAKPSHKDFKNFVTIYEEFMVYVRRLEKDFMKEGSGYDSFTGLRSAKMLKHDVKRELERLARQGKNFCIAMGRIDNFDFIRNNAPQSEVDGYVKLVAGLIKLSIRSFDDAYYLGGDEFILCLKQADLAGGIAALERLRRELERQNIVLEPNAGEQKPLSMSCCIAEPVESDDVDDLLNNLKADLQNTEEEKTDTVLRYRELSPLQRFVKEGS